MNVRELIKELEKVRNQDMDVAVEADKEDADVDGVCVGNAESVRIQKYEKSDPIFFISVYKGS